MAMRKYEVALWGRMVSPEASSARVAVNRALKAFDMYRKRQGLPGIDATLRAGGPGYEIINISVREAPEGDD